MCMMRCIAGLSVLLITVACTKPCKTWLYPSGDDCLCGSSLGTVVACNNETQEVGVLASYCLTSNGDANSTSVVGRCLATVHHGEKLLSETGNYHKVLGNLTKQDQQTCGYLNRHGQLCGKCQHNFFVSAYSYDIKCYQCSHSLWTNIVKYICIAYLPLTVFLCVVVVFRISVTSPAMNAAVLCCQLLSLPVVLRYLLLFIPYEIFLKCLATLYGIWNLDFFRLVVPPICVPLDTIHIIALDYLVAVYPLFLLVCFYLLLTAHDRGYRLVVRLWRPFLWCTARLRQRWNIRHSIIDAFATFLLLSHIKLLNTSLDLLIPTPVYSVHGQRDEYFLYYDATIVYMGPQHKLYASLAIIILLVGILFPLVLLFFYPMQWFQKFLNKCHLNSPGLQIFLRCFQGHYRDKTDGGRECRYFAVLYPAFKVAAYFMYGATLSNMFYLVFILLCILVMVTILTMQPYKRPYEFYNKFDIVVILCLVIFTIGFLETAVAVDERKSKYRWGYYTVCLFSTTPLVYFTVRFLQLVKRVLVHSSWCRLFSDPSREPDTDQQGDYRDLSASEKPLISVNTTVMYDSVHTYM